ncbi:hypothetical protein H8R23_03430 [Flavobacterium sp. F-380]|uniref:Uncharacterized protein n=1 Tax=Flavobacterium kayseriense TaxID=2764714 RepID=A0ABR7J4I2_9FLAO|nr:hypothetical protein [Flavobacterium kayseriense]MBC5840446.1 hypothetical protein [Flavobacterium kayseriense]MBC5846884.1 hypothetical protein [Flavobacterium kayseriense]
MKYLHLILASISFATLVFFLVTAYADRIKLKPVNVIYVCLSICFGLPILYFALNLIFAFLMLWYYILGAALIVLGIMSLFIPNLKIYHKIIIIVLIGVTLILYYDYRSILEINFEVIFNG